MIVDRLNNYDKAHCWQYDIRLRNYEDDLKTCGLTESEVGNLKIPDFKFVNIVSKLEKQKATEFIKRHEWLGNLSQYTTHWFSCYYRNILSGVILFNLPNAFSKMLGENTKKLERLISRGACISWSPKNLASAFLMWCIRWIVQNTQYRLFTAYSDPSAKELGTIYQACNFYYKGQSSGTVLRYINPYSGKLVSDRFFRQKTAYKKYAEELDIIWKEDWNHKTGMLWCNIPDDIEKQLRAYSKHKQETSEKIILPPKHKYAYVLGRTRKETRELRKLYERLNKVYPYPKDRGL